tara:strand:- start:401 stop:1594 length:1194 start_codon:yes stop_codon:yes gene_type:complete
MWAWFKKLNCSKDEEGNNSNTVVAMLAAGTAMIGGMFNLVFDDDDEPRRSGNSGNGGGSAWRAVGQGFYPLRFAKPQVEFESKWSFSKGDDERWASPDFDDSEWRKIKAGKYWEHQGLTNYDGFAWYRRTFKLPPDADLNNLHLRMGRIDDASETFFNGVKIGTNGRMPPEYATAWDAWLFYQIPPDLVNPLGQNTLAVRVFDEGGFGGLVGKGHGVYSSELPAHLIDLSGEWELSLTDDESLKSADMQKHQGEFSPIVVPGYWDTQGHANFDGYAWYRRSFDLVAPSGALELTLMLGRIDDQDEVFLNGTLIGSTGGEDPEIEYWRERRNYVFPASLLRSTGNVLTVRVYDQENGGGIFTGPIGIMETAAANSYWEQRSAPRRVWKTVWDWLLGRS